METDNKSEAALRVLREALDSMLSPQERQQIDLSAIDPDTSLRSLPLDSMTMIELLDRLNSAFASNLQPDHLYTSTTVGDVIRAMD
ncbi:acyl carrier protein [Nocardia huaxiensis]|uniref:Acyl carrier protein n=1 Tax=Nocardia huaxiensis TaxID=2755382 RepID=A0A7D6V5Z3_9NOCA|nr:acyl carrier protein [Nocardia huaxiensis]QLY28281.1 acyl carrier protein [Nocardia huaxiensis]UFS98284.1 acyl carrier protein [Nocardia huaxiensis]